MHPSFDEWFSSAEAALRRALIARFGQELGREAASEALTHAWSRWSRVKRMDNPIGYTYRVGERWATREAAKRRRQPVHLRPVDEPRRFEPGLEAAIAALPHRQVQVVSLIAGFGYSHSEVADLLTISRSSVQTHFERAMASLRSSLGVEEVR